MQRSHFMTRAVRCMVASCPILLTSADIFGQNQPQQVIILKDPTPREPDLEKKFARTATTPADTARLVAYNRQRLEVTQQAAAHLHALAVVMQSSLDQKQVETRVLQEIKVAEAIEASAGNVHTAMGATRKQERTKRTNDPPLAAAFSAQTTNASDVEHLVTLTNALQVDVNRSSVDMIAVGVITKSAEIQQLANRIKRRLHETTDEHK